MRVASKDSGKTRRPSAVEIVACVAGLAMLAVFFQIRADQNAQREAGVNSFLAAHSAHASEVVTATPDPSSPSLDIPDQTLWSEQRIEAFAESHAVGGKPPLAVLNIERLAIQVPVYDGADENNLNRGVARVLGTARIDGMGNLGIAGHRDGFFRPLQDVENGDVIELMTPDGLVRYEVVKTHVVNPDDVEVLAPTAERTITLVTCFPFYFVGDAPQRFIVKAVALPVKST